MSSKPLEYPRLTKLDPEVQLAMKWAVTGINQANANLAALAKAHIALQKSVSDAQNSAIQTQQQVDSLPSFDVLQSGTSSQLKVQSSVLPAHCTGFSYVATPTSITFYWDGTHGSSQIQIAWPDGTVTQVPLASLAITGLTPGATYLFYPAYNTGMNMVQFSPPHAPVASAVGTPAVAYTAANIFAASAADGDNVQSLSDGPISITTPSTGSASGKVGGK